ncbi:protein transport protein bet1 [Saxophila tyrrhenica]|uniref:Protein transport protein bet1 n=1 Tax=Saxophila tyrrhenica TaxID=1690608 RepID=A0AAV9PID0_9PEZI|nr:protein transport protein bet1 [Saxophila tyrrhenica]
MSSRLHQRSARDALFSNYDAQTRSRPASAQATPSPARPSSRTAPYSTIHGNNSSPYAFTSQPNDSSSHLSAQPPVGGGFSAYPGSSNGLDGPGRMSGDGGFRSATPDKKGRYADSVYNELESQNDEQVGVMTEKVKMLKNITMAIGDEIRDSTAFAEKMNDSFEGTRNRLRGTMNRMLRMAERTGIGWRIWLGFFAFIFFLFVYVWLF